ncbi:metallophosphoesterase [Longimicrobium sp.]|uniref:metallophosphoesterase family protein n=1 Tax=Longimicrobium sp. TaxID=2029185 RepID=UPI002B8A9F2E|nr:metallophosphoesterase [Longimicrobium sp.]HSU15958.1 metallophosphoesterase [Longimicrobium sp.]
MRIWAVSDLHSDFRENRRLLERIPAGEHRGDALIVAGDVADNLSIVSDVLGELRQRFAEVFFVPGNHELWVRGEARDSVEKFHAVLAACRAVGVRTAPARVGGAWVVPLFSWYDASFDVAGDADAESLEAWSDRYFCRWPAGAGRVDRLFAEMNEPHLRGYDAPVVSFSHFVPRPELVPPVRWLRFKGLPLVAGSVEIEAQLRRVSARVHVFGHTHIPEDRVVDGVRYVQNHLRASGSGEGGLLKRVWADGEPPAAPLFC